MGLRPEQIIKGGTPKGFRKFMKLYANRYMRRLSKILLEDTPQKRPYRFWYN